MDPLAPEYPWYTPYQFAGNNPIKFIDLDGLEPAEPGSKEGEKATARVGSGQSFPIDWKWHNGSDRLGTKAGWYPLVPCLQWFMRQWCDKKSLDILLNA